jgi:hypothetical protein
LHSIEGWGMASPCETVGSPWPPLAIRLWLQTFSESESNGFVEKVFSFVFSGLNPRESQPTAGRGESQPTAGRGDGESQVLMRTRVRVRVRVRVSHSSAGRGKLMHIAKKKVYWGIRMTRITKMITNL